MSPTTLVIVEAVLIFGGVLVFAVYQLVSVRRLQKREGDRQDDKPER
ncbi:hypothetical protein METUNv1_03949 [Methyloversatilis universalis FAM5]|jgi:uncharacterized membrane protein|uniref:Transmembrane protein n=1 Tax=Methyloversatilis universalis (strain ATCC BAA-1314 / DSM 25237 / JCM 13912 / CCUG 52030 / FAM5) TaxID=1000565 RepID=F5RHZ9_METUF|nr:hypothetical protein [Methyloversatilis universalis]EGK69981.1 hypothetical protein METUNv1_03949 [Methyloversatilis universalis FAM5]